MQIGLLPEVLRLFVAANLQRNIILVCILVSANTPVLVQYSQNLLLANVDLFPGSIYSHDLLWLLSALQHTAFNVNLIHQRYNLKGNY